MDQPGKIKANYFCSKLMQQKDLNMFASKIYPLILLLILEKIKASIAIVEFNCKKFNVKILGD
jgi:hypothetical protein